MPARDFTLKEYSEMFHHIESTEHEMLKVDSNLERTMTVHQNAHSLP